MCQCDDHGHRASGALRSGATAPATGAGRAGPGRATAFSWRKRRPRTTACVRRHSGRFKIAELDLEERGMGDLIGQRQAGKLRAAAGAVAR